MNQIPEDKNICFKKVDYDLAGLLHYIDIGDIGLPDIQRPFVWSNTKIRDLFDSMYRGFPVGYLLFWSNAGVNNTRAIGMADKQHQIPNLLIVDGQQRLTSLYAVFRGKTVLDSDYKERKIEIAFNPLEGRFEVADAAIKRDVLWISNISELWSVHSTSYSAIKTFIKKLEANKELTPEEEKIIAGNIDRLFDVQKYPFTALEISPMVDEEAVSDIFVRINSLGAKLNQADFILTLLSVFWEDGRKELESFCRDSYKPSVTGQPSSFNYFIQPSPGELLRVAVAIGFYRGSLKSVYHVLRGKDPDTDEYSPQLRDTQFSKLKQAQKEMLNLTDWHKFLSCLVGAGFRGSEMISSNITLLYTYAMFLIGRNRFNLSYYELEKLIGRWYLATSLSSRYIGSFESEMDSDLRRFKDINSEEDFIKILDSIITNTLTSDFWLINLPDTLDSSSARNPQYYAYLAAQNKLDTPVLFSKNMKIHELLDPVLRPKKKPLEKHHLFPRAWLESQGITEMNKINQIANFALVDWTDNIGISDSPPSEYVPVMKQRFSEDTWKRMCELHALPEGWESMDYETFLLERRKLMAVIIKRGFDKFS